jgi:nuclear receptor co-repressor 1
MEDKKMHSYAVIPPLLLPPEARRRKFINNNGLIQDPLKEYNERKFINMWTDAEKDIFKEKFLLHPKNFGQIGQFLERKTVSDCVQYYYLSKKTENYKQLLRKSKMRRRGRNQAAPADAVINSVPGVVTRHRNKNEEKAELNNQEEVGGSNRSTPQPNSNASTIKQEIKEEKENDDAR